MNSKVFSFCVIAILLLLVSALTAQDSANERAKRLREPAALRAGPGEVQNLGTAQGGDAQVKLK